MRMIFVVITGLVLITLITFTWYVFQPLGHMSISLSEDILGMLIGTSAQEYALLVQNNSILYWVLLLWGPVADIFVLLWMVVSAGRIEPRSEMFG